MQVKVEPGKDDGNDDATMANNWFYLVYKNFTPHERTAKEVDGLLDLSKVHELIQGEFQGNILDVCCGYGRHCIELVKRGYKVTGVDISRYMIEIALEEARKQLPNLENLHLEVADMRKLAFVSLFDVAINMYTSFGCHSDEDNLRCLLSVNRALKQNGLFFFDLNNRDYFLANQLGKHFEKIDDIIVLENISFDPIEGREHSITEYYFNGKLVHSYHLNLRRYTLSEFRNLLTLSGFKIVSVYGDFDGSAFTSSPLSKRMIVIAQKHNISSSEDR